MQQEVLPTHFLERLEELPRPNIALYGVSEPHERTSRTLADRLVRMLQLGVLLALAQAHGPNLRAARAPARLFADMGVSA